MSEYSVATPIDTFTHPVTGSEIDLVSTIHVGTLPYYAQLRSHIMGRQVQGYAVHYEAIDEGSPDQNLGLVVALKSKLREAAIKAGDDSLLLLHCNSDYTWQDETLFWPDRAENHDTTNTEYVERVNLWSLLLNLASERYSRRQIELAAWQGKTVLNELAFNAIKAGVSDVLDGTRRKGPIDRFVLDERNQIALKAIDEALTPDPAQRLVLIWGLGHRAGLQAGLEERGYERTESRDVSLAFNESKWQRDHAKGRKKLEHLQKKLDRMRARF